MICLFREIQREGLVEQVAIRGERKLDISSLDQKLSDLLPNRREPSISAIRGCLSILGQSILHQFPKCGFDSISLLRGNRR